MVPLLRRSFYFSNNTATKKKLYISLVRSQLLYGSQIWRPVQLKDIKPIASVQRRATKFILNDYTSDYRTRLIKLHILLLTMQLELGDICFFIRSLKNISPDISFNILDFISFSQNPTRSKSYNKLVQPLVNPFSGAGDFFRHGVVELFKNS